ncbi:hypothetical protein EYZ11_013482 [Aspergillus tanneri]|uniref:Uncharacterized protein n=1 Tax=Aspergillus tanneri TaxID=1220188 RepID=A0A4S3IY29_9EURO|nr:uncharacterized protein ATNIH1004_010933 [Aspergillus tanneri]KAA8641994.1 hypothetical protein ATNIH1004_010933 [Aspergillus tanneri]THC87072.1 hypothetical protein EYZ11_013482 [Aspergillus tanneri]
MEIVGWIGFTQRERTWTVQWSFARERGGNWRVVKQYWCVVLLDETKICPKGDETTLLSTEENGSLLDQHQGHVSQISRRLNNLFAFSAIGTTGRYVPFYGRANLERISSGLAACET